MKGALLSALLLVAGAAHATDVPFYLRGIDSPKDVSGINENFRSVVGDLTKLRADVDGASSAASATQTTSTGSTKFFPSTLGFTSAQTSFTGAASVTGSTLSFTVQSSTVVCWLAGSVSNGGGTWVYAGLGVDSRVNYVPGTSASIGLTNQYPATNGAGYPLSFNYEIQVTTGVQHSFWLGIWTNSGTNTFPASSGSIAQFGCREVLSR